MTTGTDSHSQGDQRENKSSRGLELVTDVSLLCTVQFGEASISIQELLTLNIGSILTLNKCEGEPLDIKANGNLVARGEAIVVNDCYGVRVTEIIDPDGRRSL